MNKILSLICLFIGVFSFSQESDTTYFKNEWCKKEVSKKKARFWKITEIKVDSTITTSVVEIATNKIHSSKSLLGEEPVGIWIIPGIDTTFQADYNFELIYSSSVCEQSNQSYVKGPFFDDPTQSYSSPTIANSNVIEYLYTSGFYPDITKKGSVLVYFNITKEGIITDISVKNGAHIALDKEAVRIVKNMKISEPAKIDGKPISLCAFYVKPFSIN